MEEILTDQTFSAAIEEEGRVLVWFGVDWCGNCNRLEPVLDRLADSLGLDLHKVMVEESPKTSQMCQVNGVPARYDDKGVPTIIVFEDGQEIGRVVGSLPEEKIVEKVSALVAS